jgi:GMP synthase-like glutamine amidotransferase
MFLSFSFDISLLGNTNEILSIQNIECESLGVLKNYFLEDGFKVYEVHAAKQKIPDSIDNFDAVILLGGPMSANDNHEYLKKEKQIVIESLKLEVPLLGICLGSQIIADSVGAMVYRGPKKEIGWGEVELTEIGKTSLFKGIAEEKIQVFHWHGDTFGLPDEAKTLSFSKLYTQAFEYKTAIGLQFHLEVTTQMILEWIQAYKEELFSEEIDKNDILFDIDSKVRNLNRYSKIVYNNFISNLI